MGKNNKKQGGGARRKGRMLAFQVIFSQGFVPSEDEDELRLAFAQSPAVLDEENSTARDFAKELVIGVSYSRPDLDEIIEQYSQNWKISRIAKIELTILRLALYEMHYTELPLKVCINEGVELSKKFGEDNSRSFINGILDAAAKAVDAGKHEVQKSF